MPPRGSQEQTMTRTIEHSRRHGAFDLRHSPPDARRARLGARRRPTGAAQAAAVSKTAVRATAGADDAR
jgi:hypothetical protein